MSAAQQSTDHHCHENCFTAALELTGRQDQHTLTRCLLDLVRASQGVRTASVYEVCTSDGSRDFSTLRGRELIVRKFSEDLEEPEETQVRGVLYQSLRESTVVAARDGLTGLMCAAFPVFGNTKVMRVLLLESSEFSDKQRGYIGQLVSLYSNQMEMMDQRERDPLTGLLNRQTFDASLTRVLTTSLDRAQRLGRKAGDSWLAVLDIDHFKQINDRYGHLYGDEILLLFSRIMEGEFRYSDLLFRYGGEEFVVILHGCDHNDAQCALERFRRAVDEYDFPTVGHVTVSIGFTLLKPGELPTTIIDQADRALYEAKESGRNQVIEARQDEAADDGEEDAIELF